MTAMPNFSGAVRQTRPFEDREAERQRKLADRERDITARERELTRMENQVSQQRRDLEARERSFARREVVAELASETNTQAGDLLLTDADRIVATSITSPAYDAHATAMAVLRAAAIGRGEQPVLQHQDDDRPAVLVPPGSANYDPRRVARLVLRAGRRRRNEA